MSCVLGLQEQKGVYRGLSIAHFEVEMVSGRVARAPHSTQELASRNILALLHVNFGEVAIHSRETIRVADYDEVSIPIDPVSRVDDVSGSSGFHWSSSAGGNIDSLMIFPAAASKSRAHVSF